MSFKLPDIHRSDHRESFHVPEGFLVGKSVEAQVELLERQLDKLTREMKSRDELNQASISDCQHQIYRLSTSSEAMYSQYSESIYREQRSLERSVHRVQEQIVAFDSRLDDHDKRLHVVDTNNERTGAQLTRLDRAVDQVAVYHRAMADDDANRTQKWMTAITETLTRRLDDCYAAIDRERCSRIDDIGKWRESSSDKWRSLQVLVDQHGLAQTAFERGFQKFIMGFQQEVKLIFVKLQNGSNQSQEIAKVLVQAEEDRCNLVIAQLRKDLQTMNDSHKQVCDELADRFSEELSVCFKLLRKQHQEPPEISPTKFDAMPTNLSSLKSSELQSIGEIPETCSGKTSNGGHCSNQIDLDHEKISVKAGSFAESEKEEFDRPDLINIGNTEYAGDEIIAFTSNSLVNGPGLTISNGLTRQSFMEICAGRDHILAISSAGTLFAWGSNTHFQCGLAGGHSSSPPSPIIIAINDRIAHIAAGFQHSVVSSVHGQVYTFGTALNGRLGTGSDEDVETPRQLDSAFDSRRIVNVAAGQYNSGFIDDLGRIWACGAGDSGQIGNRTCCSQLHPMLAILPQDITVKQLSYGDRHAAAISTDGKLLTWGCVDRGCVEQTQVGEEWTGLTPKVVESLIAMEAVQVCCGQRHTTVRMGKDGGVWSFGSGETHQIGIMDTIDQHIPVRIGLLDSPDWSISHIAVGSTISMAATTHGAIYAWGSSLMTPTPQLMTHLHDQYIVQVAAGDPDHIVALQKTQPADQLRRAL